MNRRTLLKVVVGTAATGATAFSYGTFIERRQIELKHIQCPIHLSEFSGLNGLRIALISDLHYDDFGEAGLIENAVSLINRENVDLVAITGDYISHDASVMNELVVILSELKSTHGVVSVFGNHDRWSGDEVSIVSDLTRVGFKHLVNQSIQIEGLAICGMDSIWGGKPDLKSITDSSSKSQPKIVLWHEPDTFDHYQDDSVILQMSGHTHGGQVCAPIIDEIMLPLYGRNYPKGLYQNQNSSLYVNRGLGVTSVPTRFMCRPEVTIIELVS